MHSSKSRDSVSLMAQTPAAEEAPGILLDLAALPPTPERLFEILNLVADCGYGRISIDWGASFPWSLDERFRAVHAYPEEVVAAIGRQAAAARLELIPVAPAPDALEFIHRHSGYRHLFRAGEAGLELDFTAAGGAKLYRDLVEDLLELLPGSRAIAFAAAALLPPTMEGWIGELSERGVRARPLVGNGGETTAAGSGPALHFADALFVCDGRAEADSSAGTHPAASLLFSFQAPRSSSPLRRPIELSLDWVVGRSPARGGPAHGKAAARIGAAARQAREAALRLDLLASRAWEEIRMIREGVALAALSDEAATGSLELRLERVQGVVAAGVRSCDELFSQLEKKIEPLPLQAALGSLVGPLEEEVHLLIPRVQLLGRRLRRH